MNPVRNTVLSSLLAVAGLTASAQTPRLNPNDLIGRWQSPALENLGQLYGTRDFRLTGRGWTLEFVAYGDAAGQAPLFTLQAQGSYTLGKPSSLVPGAQEADFAFNRRRLTASEAGAILFKGMGCELNAGINTDVSASGCGFIPSVASAPVEFDLLKLEGDRLYFGDRSGDLSKARPQKLNLYPVQRR